MFCHQELDAMQQRSERLRNIGVSLRGLNSDSNGRGEGRRLSVEIAALDEKIARAKTSLSLLALNEWRWGYMLTGGVLNLFVKSAFIAELRESQRILEDKRASLLRQVRRRKRVLRHRLEKWQGAWNAHCRLLWDYVLASQEALDAYCTLVPEKAGEAKLRFARLQKPPEASKPNRDTAGLSRRKRKRRRSQAPDGDSAPQQPLAPKQQPNWKLVMCNKIGPTYSVILPEDLQKAQKIIRHFAEDQLGLYHLPIHKVWQRLEEIRSGNRQRTLKLQDKKFHGWSRTDGMMGPNRTNLRILFKRYSTSGQIFFTIRERRNAYAGV